MTKSEKRGESEVMRDISNFGNNLRDEIIEYRLEHETGYTLEIKFVDHGDKTNAQIYLYSKTGEFLSKTDPFPFDQTGQSAVDRVEEDLAKGMKLSMRSKCCLEEAKTQFIVQSMIY